MKTSEQIADLAAALAKAQVGFETAARDHKAKVQTRNGGSYEFAYADFASYLEVCRKPLGDNGLSFIQDARATASAAEVVTRLLHSSGQWIESEPLSVPLIATSNDGTITAQVVGSGITYAKRYSLSSLIGMASEADDDGNAASGNTAEINRRERPKLPACPKCGETRAVIVGKAEYGGGFVCFGKKDGCGHKWQPAEAQTEPPDMAVHEQLTAKDQLTIAQVVTLFGETQSQADFMAVCDIIKTSDGIVAKSDHPELVKEQIKKAIRGHKHAPKPKKESGPEFSPEENQAA